MAKLSLKNVTKRFGNLEVIKGMDIEFNDGEFIVFVGPSGCGKSTALRMICGLEPLSGGDIEINGVSMKNVTPPKRGVAMVFQSYALYPHMTVEQNMGFSLRMDGIPKSERREIVTRAANVLQLNELLDRKPKELSGGQRQRVAIGRAIVREPKVFLFDEPLSNLDAELRVQMRFELARLHKKLDATMVYVTHDQVEAMTLADRIVIMKNGRIEQLGTPMEVYKNPCNKFVAGFIGSPSMNFFDAKVSSVTGGKAQIEFAGLKGKPLIVEAKSAEITRGQTVILGVRPEHFVIGKSTGSFVEVEVDFVEQLGGSSFIYASEFEAGPVIAKDNSEDILTSVGDTRLFGIDPRKCHLFDKNSDQRQLRM
ncbi:MAG: sn-glycerol-3-phosphate ABC transporter ATP-binding protein UgpC [Alphaproteobacteria bacterium]|nr:sn-glycerol-3-phosphate ABC transporter ATP-binding protein UgpC [Alphaproteobacteria bacterium]